MSDEGTRGYRGTLWDWAVIPFVMGLLLLGNGISGSNAVTIVLAALVILASGFWWYRRRESRRTR